MDAKSAFDSITATDLKIPLESSLVAVLLAIREQLRRGLVSRIWWVHTCDMLADALTKGKVDRSEILAFLNSGVWKVSKDTKVAKWKGTLADAEVSRLGA